MCNAIEGKHLNGESQAKLEFPEFPGSNKKNKQTYVGGVWGGGMDIFWHNAMVGTRIFLQVWGNILGKYLPLMKMKTQRLIMPA